MDSVQNVIQNEAGEKWFHYTGQPKDEIPHDITLVTIASCVKVIEQSAFSNLQALRKVVIPKTVRIIHTHAFSGCTSLSDVEFNEGLVRIATQAFFGCCKLSGIALPSSLAQLGHGSFFGCSSMLAVEIPNDIRCRLRVPSFARCTSLVTISIPHPVNQWNSSAFSGSTILGNEIAIRLLQDRFVSLPVHLICYHSSRTTLDDLISILDNHYDHHHYLDYDALADSFGMNALHIVASSVNPRVDFMECLLYRYPLMILQHKDGCGKTVLDYLLMHTSSRTAIWSLLKLILNEAIISRISQWSLGNHQWGSRLKTELESMTTNDEDDADHHQTSRRKHVKNFFGRVGYYSRVEMTSLLDLAFWKMKMRTLDAERVELNSQDATTHRETCRYQSGGAGVVIENVMGYLWDGTSNYCDTALSVFPLCSKTILEE